MTGTHTPSATAHRWEEYDHHGGPPWGARGSSLTLGFPAWGTRSEKMSPHNSWLWKSMGLTLGEPEVCKKLRLCAIRACTKTHLLQVSVQRQQPKSYMKEIHWLILGCVPEGQGSAGMLFRFGGTGLCQFLNFCSPSTYLAQCWQMHLWLSPSTLLALFPHPRLNVNPLQLVLLQRTPNSGGLLGTPELPQQLQPDLIAIRARGQPLTLVHPQQSWPSQNGRAHAAHTENTPGAPGFCNQGALPFWAPRTPF